MRDSTPSVPSAPSGGVDVWVLEPSPDGHRLQYVRALIDQGRSLGYRLRLATSPYALESEQFATHFAGDGADPGDGRTLVLPGPVSGFGARRELLVEAVRGVGRGDMILVPDGDHWMLPWLTLATRGRRFSFLIMRPPALAEGRPWFARVKRIILGLARLRGARVCSLVSALAQDAPGDVRDLLPPAGFPERQVARSRFGLDSRRPVVLLAGAIDARKSPGPVLDWLTRTGIDPRPVLLVAGRVADDSRELFYGDHGQRLRERGDLVLVDGYIPEETLRAAYAACDLTMLLYQNHAASGAVAFAAMAGCPVLAWNNRSIVGDVRRFGMGSVARSLSPADLDEAVSEILDAPASERRSLRARLVDRDTTLFFQELAGVPARTAAT